MARETYDEVSGADCFVSFGNDKSAPAQMPEKAKIEEVGYGLRGMDTRLDDTIARIDADSIHDDRRIKKPDSMY